MAAPLPSVTNKAATRVCLCNVGAVDASGKLSIRLGVCLPGVRQSDAFEIILRVIFDTAVVIMEVEVAEAAEMKVEVAAATNSF
jgi:hypothetical protein